MGHAFPHIGEGNFFLLKFIVWGCLVFLAGSHLTGTFLLKAIISLYSTVCASRLLSGLFAFKASSQVTAYIRGSSSLWMQMLPAGVSDWAGGHWSSGTPSGFCHLSRLLYHPGYHKKHRLAFSDSSYPLSLVVTVCVINEKKKTEVI